MKQSQYASVALDVELPTEITYTPQWRSCAAVALQLRSAQGAHNASQ